MSETAGKTRSLRSDIVFTFVLAFACYLAWLTRDVLVLLYVSALFAVVLSPVVRFTARLQIGRWQPFKNTAIFFLLLLVAGLLGAFGTMALLPVVRDLQTFSGELPSRLPALLEKLRNIPFAQRLNTAEFVSKLQDVASQGASYLVVLLTSGAGRLFDVVMGFVLTIYFILEGNSTYRWFLSLVPTRGRDRLDQTLRRAEVRIGKWLLGQGSLMLIFGVTSTVVYLCLGVRYAYALGVLAGLMNIVPVLGWVISMVLALLAAAVDSWGRVLGVIVFFAVYVQVENSVLIPRIMRSSVNLPGLAIIAALLLGSALEGIVGALVSVPTAVLVAVLLDEYLVAKVEAN